MIKFIKRVLFGSAEPTKTQETVREILTPQAKAVDFVVATATSNVPTVTTPTATYIEPAKPVNKVKAIGETGAKAVAAATAPKPANKKRRPYHGNKKAGGSLAKVGVSPSSVTEGATKGGNNVVKAQQPAKAKPQAPKSSKPAKK